VLTALLAAVPPSTTPPAVAPAAADPLPWNVLVPALFALGGALGGVLLSAFVEPLKLGAAHRAHVRKETLIQCARLTEVATQVLAYWSTIIMNSEGALIRRVEIDRESEGAKRRNDELGKWRHELRGSRALLKLYGSDELARAAQDISDADHEVLVAASSHAETTFIEPRGAADRLELAIEVFIVLAKEYAKPERWFRLRWPARSARRPVVAATEPRPRR
jgi:hypothetical protein